MSSIESILETMRGNPSNIRFRDLCKVCDSFFGEPRQQGSSHRVYKTPWPGDPRVNIQNKKGKAKPYQVKPYQVKPYQVKQVLKAVDKLGESR